MSTNVPLTLLRIEARFLATKFEWRRSTHMGGRPTSYGRPPDHLFFYKTASSLHFLHQTQAISVEKLRALGLQQSRESLGKKESLQRLEKRREIWESEQELKS